MPLIGALLGAIFQAVFDYFLRYMTKKVALVTSVIVVTTSLTAVLFLAFTVAIAALVVVTPPAVHLAFAFLPDNTTTCLSAFSSAALVRWTYDWNIRHIELALVQM